MTKPTPIRPKRVDGRSKRVKLAAVLAADMVGVVAVERQTGIPEATIRYWANQPQFAEIRAKTREDLLEEVKVVAHLAWARVAATMPTMEPRDALFAADKASMMLQLLSGQATARNETVSNGMNDHERAALKDVILRVVTEA